MVSDTVIIISSFQWSSNSAQSVLEMAQNENSVHVPVLLQEAVELLKPFPGGVYLDGTMGGGGHTEAIFRAVGLKGLVISLDRDVTALDRTEKRLREMVEKEFGTPVSNTPNTKNQDLSTNNFPIRFVHANYRYFEEVLDLLKIDKIDGILLDLGLSSDQLADRERGFSFDSDGLLDLRFDTSEGETGYDLLARIPEEEIADIIYRYGEERFSRRIARKIVQFRQEGNPVRTARQLADLVRSCIPRRNETRRKGNQPLTSIDPATRTFQAIRIAVNDELGSLEKILRDAPKRLKTGAAMAVISFHSLEDRMVKNAFRDDPRWEPITKKPIVASERELERNPRSRSAKLRAACRRQES